MRQDDLNVPKELSKLDKLLVIENLLLEYAEAAYWHGERTGEYGKPDPEKHKDLVDYMRRLIYENQKNLPGP